MRSIFYTLLAAAFFLCTVPHALSGQVSGQVIIANGGTFSAGNSVTVAAWNVSTNNYFVFDSIPASSVQDVIIDGRTAYVAADSTIRAYDIDNYSIVASVPAEGPRKLAVWDNFLIVTRGFPTSDYYVQFRDKVTLDTTPNGRVPVPTAAEGIAVATDTAYIALPGSFLDTTGSIAVISLLSRNIVSIVDLDTLGTGISRVYFNPLDDDIYTINNQAFGSSYGAFTRLDRFGNIPQTTRVPYPVGGGAGIYNNKLYGNFDNNFTTVDLPSFTPAPNPIVPGSFVGSAVDTSRSQFYLTTTDFFSTGRFFNYNNTGTLLDSFDVGISPEALAIDYNLATSAKPLFSDEVFITAYPNPFTERIAVDAQRLPRQPQSIDLININGQVLAQAAPPSHEMEVAHLPAGTYFVRVRTSVGDYIQPVLKR